MILVEGNILKMEGRVVEGLVHYRLPIGKERIEMNPLVGEKHQTPLLWGHQRHCHGGGDQKIL